MLLLRFYCGAQNRIWSANLKLVRSLPFEQTIISEVRQFDLRWLWVLWHLSFLDRASFYVGSEAIIFFPSAIADARAVWHPKWKVFRFPIWKFLVRWSRLLVFFLLPLRLGKSFSLQNVKPSDCRLRVFLPPAFHIILALVFLSLRLGNPFGVRRQSHPISDGVFPLTSLNHAS